MIGTEEGQTPYLVSYAGLNSQRKTLNDFIMYDITQNTWHSLAQTGFIPVSSNGQFGAYNFAMTYDDL